jgi:hypothetical protein
MAENTKTPPNQDQRQRTPQGDVNKPQKPTVNNPDRSVNPGRPMPGQDPAGKDRVTKIDDDDDLDDITQTQRQDRNIDRD